MNWPGGVHMDSVLSFLASLAPAEPKSPTSLAPQIRNEAFAQFMDRWAGFREGSYGMAVDRLRQTDHAVGGRAAIEHQVLAQDDLAPQSLQSTVLSESIDGRVASKTAEAIQGGQVAKNAGLGYLPSARPLVGAKSVEEGNATGFRGRPDKYLWSRLAAAVVTNSLEGPLLVVRGDAESTRLLKANLDRLQALARELGIPVDGVVVNGDHAARTVKGVSNGD